MLQEPRSSISDSSSCGIEQCRVGPQAEEKTGRVGDDEDDRDGEREVLDVAVEVDSLVAGELAGHSPSTSSKTAGMISAAIASRSIVDCTLAAVCPNFWTLCLRCPVRPPTSIAAPMTSRTLPRIEPMIEALTTSCSPLPRANRAMISSGALPKVTLSRPPITLPERSATSSVARPIRAAVGISATAETKKITVAGALTRSAITAARIRGESR